MAIPLPGNTVPTTSCQTVNQKNPPKNAAPTGVIWNPSPAFLLPGTSNQATFIFATLTELHAALDRVYKLAVSLPDAPLARFRAN